MEITEYLKKTYSSFNSYLECKQHKLCFLKNLNYEIDHIPQYENKQFQEYYILRYGLAYTFEYMYMLKDLPPTHPSISITSLGCGSALDYLGISMIQYAFESIDYTGIDRVKWHHIPDIRQQDTVTIKNMEISDYFNNCTALPTEIYIFPKSISEMTAKELKPFLHYLIKHIDYVEELHIFASLRTTSFHEQEDTIKLSQIKQKLIDNEYLEIDSNIWTFKEEYKDKGFISLDSRFKLPQEALDLITELAEHCPDASKCTDLDNCKTQLQRYPILKCRNSNWVYMKLKGKKANHDNQR